MKYDELRERLLALPGATSEWLVRTGSPVRTHPTETAALASLLAWVVDP